MPEQLARKHILVLSDDEDVRLVIRDLMEDEGYDVTNGPYLTGEIDAVLRSSPDAILIDCRRMELDGSVVFLRRVREEPRLRDIPIIASTSAVRVIDDYQTEIEELGLHIVRKPFDIELLADVVAECLAEQQSPAP